MPSDDLAIPWLFIGDESLGEFAPAASWLASRGAKFASTVAEAIDCIRAGYLPAMMIVAQPWPGHVTPKEIESLRRAAPLARVTSLLGSWLEGEARTGKPWPAVWRTYWHHWLPRFAIEFERLAERETSVWSLPEVAGDEERLFHLCTESDRPLSPELSTRTIAVVSKCRPSAESLGDVCRQRRWKWRWLKSSEPNGLEGIDLVLFDARNLNAGEIVQIESLRRHTNDVPVIVVMGFPRIDDVHRLRQAGATAIVSKPFLSTELAWQIEQLLGKSPCSSP